LASEKVGALKTISRLINKAFVLYSKHGFRTLVRELAKKIGLRSISSVLVQQNILDDYDFVKLPNLPSKSNGARTKSINWYVPVVGKGSGGHGNIFRFIRALEKLGVENRIVLIGPGLPRTSKEAARQITEWFFPLKAKVYRWGEVIPEAKVGMATEWRTAYYLRSSGKEELRTYFIQDFEPWFFPKGTHYALAEETYRFGFRAITAGSWLSGLVERDYKMTALPIGFPPDLETYGKRYLDKRGTRRKIFFYARPPTPRRDFELGLLALQHLLSKRRDITVVLAGWDLSTYKIPFRHESFGVLGEEQLPELYARADVALVLSATNVSLLPVDLMACEIPIVSNRGPHVEWLLNDRNSFLCDLTVESISETLSFAIDNPDESRERVDRAKLEVSKLTWEGEAQKAVKFLGLAD
jgi:glycosyltransferase involved in cell wall biosynthesis